MLSTLAFVLAAAWLFRLTCAAAAAALGAKHAFAWRRTFRRDLDGPVYMVRRQLLRSPWVDVYLNHILQPDTTSENPHNHPWREAYSVKLWREYVEQIYWGMGCCMSYFRTPRRFSRIPNIHRIVAVPAQGCWTLFVGLRRHSDWGFFDLANGGKFVRHDKAGHNG